MIVQTKSNLLGSREQKTGPVKNSKGVKADIDHPAKLCVLTEKNWGGQQEKWLEYVHIQALAEYKSEYLCKYFQ